MAEYVSLRTEELVPLAEELQRTNILSSKEIRAILEDFNNFEYKIERRERKLTDVLEYIGYERRLLKKIKKKRKIMNFAHKREEIEDKLITKIHSQFGSAKKTFSHDLKFWKAYVEFLRNLKSWTAISALYQELIRLHGSKYPHLFKNASHFEFNLNPSKGIDTARLQYKQGFRMHPKNMDLIIDAFSLELKYIDYLYSNRDAFDFAKAHNNGEEIVTELKIVKVLYEQATKDETQARVFLDFVFATLPYEFAATFREKIIEDIKLRCDANEATYDKLAKLAMRSNDYERGIQQYHLGLQLKPTEKMYDYFVESLWMLISKVSDNYIPLALPVFQQAHDSNNLSVNGYLLWSRVKGKDNPEKESKVAKAILELGINRFKLDYKIDIWMLNIEMVKLKLRCDFDPREVQNMLNCIENSKIPEDIWKETFLALTLKRLTNSNLDTFVESVKNNDVKLELRIWLLQHIRYNCSRKEARAYYEKYHLAAPQSYSFHQAMINLELLQMDESTIGFVRKCYNYAVYLFGSSVPKVWSEGIHFEKHVAGDFTQSNGLYSRALRQLGTDDLIESFVRAEVGK